MYRLFIAFALLALFTGSGVAADKVVLVGSGAPDASDALIIERLQQMGFTVEPHAHDEKHPVDLSGVALVFISESTSSGNITNAYADSTVPVINCEAWTYDDMGFAPDDSGFNSDAGDTLIIVSADHPITQGFPEQVRVHDPAASLISASNLAGDVKIVAVRADDKALAAISVYEEGAQTVTGKTQARHVNIFPHSTGWSSITDDGWKLIERSVLYAVEQLTAVEPIGKLAVRWADIRTQINR